MSSHTGVIDTEAVFSSWPAIKVNKIYETVVSHQCTRTKVRRPTWQVSTMISQYRELGSEEPDGPLSPGGRDQAPGHQKQLKSARQESCVVREALSPRGDALQGYDWEWAMQGRVTTSELRPRAPELRLRWARRSWTLSSDGEIRCSALDFQVSRNIEVP